jgi:hypothetical protein
VIGHFFVLVFIDHTGRAPCRAVLGALHYSGEWDSRTASCLVGRPRGGSVAKSPPRRSLSPACCCSRGLRRLQRLTKKTESERAGRPWCLRLENPRRGTTYFASRPQTKPPAVFLALVVGVPADFRPAPTPTAAPESAHLPSFATSSCCAPQGVWGGGGMGLGAFFFFSTTGALLHLLALTALTESTCGGCGCGSNPLRTSECQRSRFGTDPISISRRPPCCFAFTRSHCPPSLAQSRPGASGPPGWCIMAAISMNPLAVTGHWCSQVTRSSVVVCFWGGSITSCITPDESLTWRELNRTRALRAKKRSATGKPNRK